MIMKFRNTLHIAVIHNSFSVSTVLRPENEWLKLRRETKILILALIQSAENHRKECHIYWLRLRDAVIIISNTQVLAFVKINWMALK